MTIIAEQEIHQKTLQKALFVLDQDVRTYIEEANGEAEEDGLYLYVLSEKNIKTAMKRAEKAAVFAIDATEGVFKDTDHEFITLMTSPVRLGTLVQSIASYQKHKAQQQSLSPVKMGIYTLDQQSNQLIPNKKGEAIKLTEKEQDILLFLYAQKAKPVARQDLLNEVWGYAEEAETHTLETHIYRLRQKVENDPAAPNFLMTNDEGYYLNLGL